MEKTQLHGKVIEANEGCTGVDTGKIQRSYEKQRVLYGMELWLNKNKQDNIKIMIGLVKKMKD